MADNRTSGTTTIEVSTAYASDVEQFVRYIAKTEHSPPETWVYLNANKEGIVPVFHLLQEQGEPTIWKTLFTRLRALASGETARACFVMAGPLIGMESPRGGNVPAGSSRQYDEANTG